MYWNISIARGLTPFIPCKCKTEFGPFPVCVTERSILNPLSVPSQARVEMLLCIQVFYSGMTLDAREDTIGWSLPTTVDDFFYHQIHFSCTVHFCKTSRFNDHSAYLK